MFLTGIVRSPGILSLLLAVATLLASCRSARRGEPFTGAPAVLNAPEGRGKLVFMRHCHHCHPGGEGGLGPALNNKPLPRALVKMQVRAGLGTMPAFGPHEISPEALEDLTLYLTALRKHPE